MLHFLACQDSLSTSLLITAFILQRPLLRDFQVLLEWHCIANIAVMGEDWMAFTLGCIETVIMPLPFWLLTLRAMPWDRPAFR